MGGGCLRYEVFGPIFFGPRILVLRQPPMSPRAPFLPPRKQNPFEIGLIAQGNHFADREEEVERIARAFQSPGSRLVVYGDRRLGKSSAMDRAGGGGGRGGEGGGGPPPPP